MRIRRIYGILILFIVVIIALSTAGVYATWQYANNSTFESTAEFQVSVNEFYYKPDEFLPGDENATELHENHSNLIINIVNHIDYGLNATKKPLVQELLEDGAGVVYSNQNVSGGNLKHMLLNSSDVEALMFVVEYETSDKYNAYTFSSRLVTSENLGKRIDVYKTVIIKENNVWSAERSYLGTAPITYPGIVNLSIDVKQWN